MLTGALVLKDFMFDDKLAELGSLIHAALLEKVERQGIEEDLVYVCTRFRRTVSRHDVAQVVRCNQDLFNAVGITAEKKLNLVIGFTIIVQGR